MSKQMQNIEAFKLPQHSAEQSQREETFNLVKASAWSCHVAWLHHHKSTSVLISHAIRARAGLGNSQATVHYRPGEVKLKMRQKSSNESQLSRENVSSLQNG